MNIRAPRFSVRFSGGLQKVSNGIILNVRDVFYMQGIIETCTILSGQLLLVFFFSIVGA